MTHLISACLTLALLSLTACATNPATGGTQLSLVGENTEISIGRKNDTAIVNTMGLYPDDALQRYMQELGGKLAAISERPNLPWTFRLVDEPIVNAFAVPGGYVYMTRGILAHLNSEAQVAAVLGHEIGHITARHSVEQMSRAQLAQVGLGIGMILSPTIRQAGDLASGALGVLFLKFGRDDETQADELGLRYLVKGGYDPRPMPEVYAMLARTGGGEGDRIPTWLSTHPDPANRRERMLQQIAALNQPFEGRPVGRDSYLRRLDGMLFGSNPREGYFDGSRFLHPDFAFEIWFPPGWKTANQKQAVKAMSPAQDAMMEVSLAQGTPDSAARVFFRDVQAPEPPRRTTIHGLSAVVGEFVAAVDQGSLGGLAAFIDLGGKTFRVLGYGVRRTWTNRGDEVNRAAGTFQRLTDRSALDIKPKRISIVQLTEPMTLAQFNARWPSDTTVEQVALINQAEAATVLPAGSLVKRVVRAR